MGDKLREFIEKVREANRIEKVMPEFVPDFKGFEAEGTAKLKCLCPFHEGDAPSFVVYKRDQYYRCFACELMGDVLDLVQGLKAVDFPQALHLLARRAEIQTLEPTPADLHSELEFRALQDILGAAADFYYRNFVEFLGGDGVIRADQNGENIIEEARLASAPGSDQAQLLDKLLGERRKAQNAVREAKWGFARGSGLAQHLARKGFDLDMAKKAGVVRQDGSDFFQDTWVTPYFDKGRVVYMSGLWGTDSEHPLKGRDQPVTEVVRAALPIAEELQKAGKLIVVVEGYADAWALKKWGYKAVPLAGMALSEQESRLLRDPDKVYVWFESSALKRAIDLGKRIVRESGVVPWIVELSGNALGQHADGPRDYVYDSCEGRLEQSRQVLYMMLEDIPSLGGGDWENAVREFFGCLCCLSQGETAGWKDRAVTNLGITNRDFETYVKTARRRERISQHVPPRDVPVSDVPEGSCLVIHPALDYLEQIGVVSVALDMIIENRVVTRPYMITSDRQRLEPDGAVLQMEGQRILFRSEPKAPCEKRWRKADIDRFLAGDDPDPGQTFSRLLDIVKRHIDFRDPVEAEILAIWCMGSYLFPLFTSYPYLHLYGFKGTGKTQTMTLASKLAFNMVLASGITPSATFRLVQSSRCCVGLDEAENLRGARDQDTRELLGLLRAGCKKGAAAIRAEAVPDKGLMAIQYDVYSPKMIASIDPIEDILGSRCISINMLRTENPEIGRVELSDNAEDWAGLRHELYCFALGHFKEVRQLYADEASLRILLNRDHELWLPLFSVAKLLDKRGANGVLDRLVEYAREASAEASDSGLEEFDLALMEVLVSLVGKDRAEAKWIAAKEMEGHLRQVLAGSHLPRDVPQSIGYSLRNLGLLHSPRSKKRTATGVMYYIQPGQLTSVCDRWGIAALSDATTEGTEMAGVTGSGPQLRPQRSRTHRAHRHLMVVSEVYEGYEGFPRG